jgi:hypothetical protein
MRSGWKVNYYKGPSKTFDNEQEYLNCLILTDENEIKSKEYWASYDKMLEGSIPCGPGDSVFFIESNGKGKTYKEIIKEAIVDHIIIGEIGYTLSICDPENNWSELFYRDLGESWFLRRAEAEKSLRV